MGVDLYSRKTISEIKKIINHLYKMNDMFRSGAADWTESELGYPAVEIRDDSLIIEFTNYYDEGENTDSKSRSKFDIFLKRLYDFTGVEPTKVVIELNELDPDKSGFSGTGDVIFIEYNRVNMMDGAIKRKGFRTLLGLK